MIRITSFAKKKSDNNNITTASNNGYANAVTTVKKDLDTHLIFGHEFNGTQDVEGELNNVTNINATGTISGNDAILNNNVTVGNTLTAPTVTATNGNITTVNSTNTNTTNLDATNAEIDNLDATDIESINMTTQYLTVTKQAHFWELIIDKMKSTEGAFILSPASAKIEKVDTSGNNIKLCWRTTDISETIQKSRTNDFEVGDQILCLNFNMAYKDTTTSLYNAYNKYYWGLVIEKGVVNLYDEVREVNCDWHYIVLSPTDFDAWDGEEAAMNIEVGDDICVLGNRNDSSRQNAIILSCVNSAFLDETSIQAPSIVQYKGIQTYHLARYRLNTIAANGNVFYGDFMVYNGGSNDNVLDLINDSKSNIAEIRPDSNVTLIMTDQNGDYNSLNAGVGLVTNVEVYLGNTKIPTSEMDDAVSYVEWRNDRFFLDGGGRHSYVPGIAVNSITVNSYDIDINYTYHNPLIPNPDNSVTATDTEFKCYVKFTHDNITYEKELTIPAKVVKTEKGTDAELDMMFIDDCAATVTLQDTLKISAIVYAYHVKGTVLNQVTNLSDYNCTMTSNAGDSITLNKSNNGWFYYSNDNYISDYSEQQTKQTSYTLKLFKSGQLTDQKNITVTFDSGAIFQVQQDAITSAVSQSRTYTDGQITTVNNNISRIDQTATQISSRVTAIENDYVTGSELTQTANNIQLSVYNELNQRTGIDVTNGQITLNADNTTIVGNLNLTDANDGLTLYDSDGIPRINLQPQQIEDITEMSDDAYTSFILNYNGTASQYQATTSSHQFTLEKGDIITIRRITSQLYSTGSVTHYPSSNVTYCNIYINKPDSTTYAYSFQLTKLNNYGTYAYNNKLNYQASLDGNYTIYYTITNNSSFPSGNNNLYADLNAAYEVTKSRQTYIGLDGIYCHSGANKMLYSNEEQLRLQFGFNGLKWQENNTSNVMPQGNRTMQTVVGIKGNSPDIKPIWMPFYNYIPTFEPTNYLKGNITNTGHTNKYYYTINPLNDVGLCLINTPAMESGEPQQTWVLLPPTTITDNDNDTVDLPIGYTVTVINNTIDSNKVNVYVTGTSNALHNVIIIDSNRNSNYYSELYDTTSNDTFIYTGTYNGIAYWRQMRDTQ